MGLTLGGQGARGVGMYLARSRSRSHALQALRCLPGPLLGNSPKALVWRHFVQVFKRGCGAQNGQEERK